jgi:ribonuclease BN (tRNA processing enzyme)
MEDRVTLQVLGSGDAFGSGGRFQTCLLLRGGDGTVLIDCGASSLIAMKRAGVDPGEVGWILLSHLHGDHFGGLPFLVLDAQFSRRTRPLVIAGPPGVRARVTAAMEVFFPGSSRTARRFPVEYVELLAEAPASIGPTHVIAFPVEHASGAPSYALRVRYGGKTVAYSGDTAWTDGLVKAARGADLLVCEAYFFDKRIPYHLDYRTLEANQAQLECRRILVTHMSQDMLDHAAEVTLERAEDGQVVAL